MASNLLASALASNPSFGPTVNTSAPLTAATTGYGTPQAPPTVQAVTAAPKAPVVNVPSLALAAAAKQTPGPNLTGTYAAIGAKEKAAATATGGSGSKPPATTAIGAATPGEDPSANKIVSGAKSMLGVPYLWGGTNTKTGLDCSAFVQAAYAKAGIAIPRTTYAQFQTGTPVALNKLQPGDAVYVEPQKAGPGHVGLYIGNGQIQESPHTGTVNQVVPLAVFVKDGYVGSRRF